MQCVVFRVQSLMCSVKCSEDTMICFNIGIKKIRSMPRMLLCIGLDLIPLLN